MISWMPIPFLAYLAQTAGISCALMMPTHLPEYNWAACLPAKLLSIAGVSASASAQAITTLTSTSAYASAQASTGSYGNANSASLASASATASIAASLTGLSLRLLTIFLPMDGQLVYSVIKSSFLDLYTY